MKLICGTTGSNLREEVQINIGAPVRRKEKKKRKSEKKRER
jgi:hypothetical protein